MEKTATVIKYIKLITGNYVIGKEIKSESNEVLVLEKPVSIEFNPMAGGLGFVPYDAFYLGKEVEKMEFKNQHIMHVFEAEEIPEEIAKKYTEFLTGIVTDVPQGQPSESEIAKMLQM